MSVPHKLRKAAGVPSGTVHWSAAGSTNFGQPHCGASTQTISSYLHSNFGRRHRRPGRHHAHLAMLGPAVQDHPPPRRWWHLKRASNGWLTVIFKANFQSRRYNTSPGHSQLRSGECFTGVLRLLRMSYILRHLRTTRTLGIFVWHRAHGPRPRLCHQAMSGFQTYHHAAFP